MTNTKTTEERFKTMEEVKKYINKSVFTAIDFENSSVFKIKHLYIGGINLFYNQVNYVIEGFKLYEDKKLQLEWGILKKEAIGDKFDASERTTRRYFFSKIEAKKYAEWLQKDAWERAKDYDVRTARELLEKHKIKYEIFGN